MYEDKTLICKECGKEFVLQQVSRSSMLKRLCKRAPEMQGLPRCKKERC